jgi:hypothetical protein
MINEYSRALDRFYEQRNPRWVGTFTPIEGYDLIMNCKVESQMRIQFTDGRYVEFVGAPDEGKGEFGVIVKGPVLQGSIYDREGAD